MPGWGHAGIIISVGGRSQQQVRNPPGEKKRRRGEDQQASQTPVAPCQAGVADSSLNEGRASLQGGEMANRENTGKCEKSGDLNKN